MAMRWLPRPPTKKTSALSTQRYKRHACATHLLASGFTLKQIGDHLGHRSAYATRVYAKVDLAGLRQVAEFDLRGLL
ncbi:tyrosine-type recombinase/integrase [Paraburkholderia aromaticivorans]|uniref:tyrosine-type recombinase/integrase n=1 Tax=Paraburkholderia aromaticivorans TaxID=2026199 RepID=UPI001F0FC1B1|nr:tyrosine-type recombinase/integrase [Paraburkholderia aromaticivorans]